MDTFNQNIEYQNALNFLKIGCDCGCSDQISHEKFARFRSDFQNLPKLAQDVSIMTQLTFMSGGTTANSSRLKNKERTNHRTFYQRGHKTPLCQQTYLNMLGISQKYLKNIKKHLANKGLTTRTHSGTGRMPQWKTKLLIDKKVKQTVKNFLEDYANAHGLPNPAGKTRRTEKPIIELPTEMTYKSVHRDFLETLEDTNYLKQMKYHTFYKLWHQLTPHIQFMKPETDLCNTCHKFRNDLHSCLSQIEEEELKNLPNTSPKLKKRGNIITRI